MIKALNPESLDPADIERHVKHDRNSQYLTGEAFQRAVQIETNKRISENRQYKVLLFLNLTLLLASAVFFVLTIINIFKGNWNYVAGFGVVTYLVFWVFRRIPWPMSRRERTYARLDSMLRRIGR